MENKEFKPYVPADKVTPEFTATSIIIGGDDGFGVDSGCGYFDGSNPSNYEKRFDSGEQHGADNRFCR